MTSRYCKELSQSAEEAFQSTLLPEAANAATRGAEAVIRLHKGWLEDVPQLTLCSAPTLAHSQWCNEMATA